MGDNILQRTDELDKFCSEESDDLLNNIDKLES